MIGGPCGAPGPEGKCRITQFPPECMSSLHAIELVSQQRLISGWMLQRKQSAKSLALKLAAESWCYGCRWSLDSGLSSLAPAFPTLRTVC